MKLGVSSNISPMTNVHDGGYGEINNLLKPVFNFSDFHLNSIKIEKEFNNYYKDQGHYERIISHLFGVGVGIISNEVVKGLTEDYSKQDKMHFHPIGHNKSDIITKILKQYNFSESRISNILEGDSLYQFEIPYENGAARVIFEFIDPNLFYPLFIDVNHHIYFNEKMVENARSLFYEECPVYFEGKCYRMDYLGTCFAFEYLDQEKIAQTYGFKFNPV